MRSVLSSVRGSEVVLLHWFCSGFDDKLPKKKKKIKPEIYEVRSLKEKPGSDTNMFCDLKKN